MFEETAELVLEYEKRFNVYSRSVEEPLIWIKDKYDRRYLISGYDEIYVLVEDIWLNVKELFENYTFLDNSPCGIQK